MWGDIFKAIAISTILPMFTGGGGDGKQSGAPGGTGSVGDGLMSSIWGIGGDMFTNMIMGKFTQGEKASARVSSYMPDMGGAYLDTGFPGGAGSADKLHAVNPKDNERAMEILLTKMLTSPVYSERIG